MVKTALNAPETPVMNEKLLLFLLAMVQFTHIIDFMIIMPLGKQFMQLFDISPQQFSVIVSAYALSAFAVGFLSAMYIDRFDRKKALAFTYLGFTLGTFACGLANDYWQHGASPALLVVCFPLWSFLLLAMLFRSSGAGRRWAL